MVGMVFHDKSKARVKKKRVVKKISRDEEDEEDEMKPLEEKVVHRQKARLSVKDGEEWEERGYGYVKVIKHLRTGQLRLEMRGEQYGEVCLSQRLNQEVQVTFSKSGATGNREQSEMTLDTKLDQDRFKAALLLVL